PLTLGLPPGAGAAAGHAGALLVRVAAGEPGRVAAAGPGPGGGQPVRRRRPFPGRDPVVPRHRLGDDRAPDGPADERAAGRLPAGRGRRLKYRRGGEKATMPPDPTARDDVMESLGIRTLTSQLADDFAWLEDHCRRQPDQAGHAGKLRLAAALV